jgi:hypothetical protein
VAEAEAAFVCKNPHLSASIRIYPHLSASIRIFCGYPHVIRISSASIRNV